MQLVVLAVGGVAVVTAVRALPPAAAVSAMCVITGLVLVAAFVPIGGRSFDEWIPVLAKWALQGITGRVFISETPTSGLTALLDPQPDLPPSLRGLTILAHRISAADGEIGVIKDQRAGTFTAILAVRGRSFALLDGQEKARRLATWAGILSGLAREGGLVYRIQWVERIVPDPGDEIGSYLKENIAVPLDSVIARSYLEVVDEAGPVTQQHETFIALQLHAGRSARRLKRAGGGDQAACQLLSKELVNLASNLVGAEIVIDGALTPRLVARALRTGFDPTARQTLAQTAAQDPQRSGNSLINAAPMAAQASWSTYGTDGAWHRTYWIAEWPRIEVDPDFLAPLLLRTERMRTVSVVMEPISPLKAIRSVESARTSAEADEELRRRAGFVTTTRRAREQESLADHERDLGDGHAFYRFSGFVTVTAFDADELEAACVEVEEAAARSLLDIRRLNGQQDSAFTYTLPLCRGIK